MKAFVTGATGFVGSHLVEALLADGHQVTCLARNPAKAASLFGDHGPRLVAGDLSKVDALEAGCRGAEIVFHAAGLVAAGSLGEFYAVNRDGTARVLDAVRRVAGPGTRVIYVSSLSAAGPTRRGRALTEADPPHPVSNYGRSKLAGEEAVRSTDLPWTVVRPPAVYGPRDVETLRMYRVARLGWMPMYTRPDQELSFIHARDLARALVAAAAPRCAGRTYFAAHPRSATAREMMTIIFRAVRAVTGKPARAARFLPIPRPLAVSALWVLGTAARLTGRTTVLSADKGHEFLAEAWTCSPAALEQDTGWWADTDLETGVRGTAEWYAQHGWL